MKKFLKIFFIFLGALFLIIILAIMAFFIFDPFNLKSLPNSGISVKSVVQTTLGKVDTEIDDVDKNPLVTQKQEAMLESLGVDPSDLPTEITPAMEECFVEKLGAERVSEITQGDSPTAAEFLRAGNCF
jgi:hypothetical protein